MIEIHRPAGDIQFTDIADLANDIIGNGINIISTAIQMLEIDQNNKDKYIKIIKEECKIFNERYKKELLPLL